LAHDLRMNASERSAQEIAWAGAMLAATLLAVDPHGLGGIVVRAGAGPVRDRWVSHLRACVPEAQAWRRMPTSIADERLLGGLDLAATLNAGKPVAQRGLLAESDGGVVLVPMAERLSAGTAARLCATLDSGEVWFERDGLSHQWPARVAIVAFDESTADDPPPAAALLQRLAFSIDLRPLSLRDCADTGDAQDEGPDAHDVLAARQLLPQVVISDAFLKALCGTALQLGVHALRASQQAVRAARAAAALAGRHEVNEDDAQCAARLVLAPRATQRPVDPTPSADDEEQAPPEPQQAQDGGEAAPPPPPLSDADAAASPPEPPTAENTQAMEDRLIEATLAALPAQLLASLLGGAGGPQSGRVGALTASPRFGRPVGTRRGEPRSGARLNLLATLRAAAPWQRVRAQAASNQHGGAKRLHVHADDLRVSRLQQRAATATLFVVDASGSSALNRLAEAKGAVNLLLADCYVRRDQVGVIAFRGQSAEVLLPPTRSLVRAKRSLAGLPGGGGTPLASALQAAWLLAQQVRRAGATPVVVLLTDGRGNIALNGEPGRVRAEEDALAMARLLRAAQVTCLLIDTSAQPAPAAQRLAQALAAQYRALPYAGAKVLQAAVKTLQSSAPSRLS
jgi:magnesium chelatase subunit D